MRRPTPEKRLFVGFFKDFDGVRWEVKRSPQGRYRLRYVMERRPIYGLGIVVPVWHWWYGAPVFENPVAAVLWFERYGKTLLKYKVNLNAR